MDIYFLKLRQLACKSYLSAPLRSALLITLAWHLLFLMSLSFEAPIPTFAPNPSLAISVTLESESGSDPYADHLSLAFADRPALELRHAIPLSKKLLFSSQSKVIQTKQIQALDALTKTSEQVACLPPIKLSPSFSFRILAGGSNQLLTKNISNAHILQSIRELPGETELICQITRVGSPTILGWNANGKQPSSKEQALLNTLITELFQGLPEPKGLERTEIAFYFSPPKDSL